MQKQTKLSVGGAQIKPQNATDQLSSKGLTLILNYLNEQKEQQIVYKLEQQQWSNDLKRKTIQYGYRYNYQTKRLQGLPNPIPDWLGTLNENDQYDQLIVNKYEKGEGISKHTDHKSYFKNQVCIVSLLSDCEMVFSKKGQPSTRVTLPRRSKIILKDEIRYEWTHEINRVRHKRISLTFRSVRQESLTEQTKLPVIKPQPEEHND